MTYKFDPIHVNNLPETQPSDNIKVVVHNDGIMLQATPEIICKDVTQEFNDYRTTRDAEHTQTLGDIASIKTTQQNIQTNLEQINSNLDNMQPKIDGYGLSETSFTQAEKQKLSTFVEHYAGRFLNIDDLNLVTGSVGGYAYVSIDNAPTVLYAWNGQTSKWESTVSAVSEETPESVKIKYEANSDTNNFSNLEKQKLSEIESKATKNDTDANLKNRANHTGSQPISSITDLASTITNINNTNTSQTTSITNLQNSKQNTLVSGTSIKTFNGLSLLGSGNIVSDPIISTTTANGVKQTEYSNRFEYTCKILFDVTVPSGIARYLTQTYTTTLPVGVTIDSCDEFYISAKNPERGLTIAAWDNSSRKIVLGFGNTWQESVTSKGTVFIKLIKYK